ncbi:MAG TPA: lysoplasmalogenase [Nocardioides sp.]|uniref:lysoplasmalogenase n=1 Tax=Nocardioides sp. TaxID=35761 RepID=UPI002D7EA3C1|nr:lysoplasmalogenase [Nocardioides sp.]HET6652170.1 lysoplasmalogenase [Nocardioides sp.]
MPTPRTLAATAAYVALAATDTVLAGRTDRVARRARFLVKPLLMPALAVAFHEGTRAGDDPMLRRTAAAQAFSWGGDVALLGRGEKAFLAGVGSFFAAHVAYVAGFASARAPAPTGPARGGVKAAAALWVAAGPAMAVAAGRRSPRLAAPVAAYAGVLATMFGASTALDPAMPRRARTTVRAGTTLFLVSDTLLGVQDFLLTEPHPALERAVMATYTAGQGLIAWGVAQGLDR